MNLATLIDLEWSLRQDATADSQPLKDRDRRLGRDILESWGMDAADAIRGVHGENPALRRMLCEAWVIKRRLEEDMPGVRLERGYRLIAWLALALALLLSWGAVKAVLSSREGEPVNVAYFLAVLVFFQLFLLVVLGLTMIWKRMRGRPSELGFLARLFKAMSRMRWVDKRLHQAVNESAIRNLLPGPGRQETLHASVERWWLFTVTQKFGVAFNGMAIVACLFFITFTHLEFIWSTTLQIEPEFVHGGIEILALPWAWLSPDSIPDLELVRASRNVIEAGADTGPWWTFLVLSLVFWGLLPRIALLALAAWGTRRAVLSLDFSRGSLQQLYDRLLPREASWDRPEPSPLPQGRRAPLQEKAPLPASRDCQVIPWRFEGPAGESLQEMLEARFGWRASAVTPSGGADPAADARSLSSLAKNGSMPVILMVDAGDSPTKDARRYLSEVRKAIDSKTSIVIGVLEDCGGGQFGPASKEDFLQWQRFCDEMGDPYLRVESMIEGA